MRRALTLPNLIGFNEESSYYYYSLTRLLRTKLALNDLSLNEENEGRNRNNWAQVQLFPSSTQIVGLNEIEQRNFSASCESPKWTQMRYDGTGFRRDQETKSLSSTKEVNGKLFVLFESII